MANIQEQLTLTAEQYFDCRVTDNYNQTIGNLCSRFSISPLLAYHLVEFMCHHKVRSNKVAAIYSEDTITIIRLGHPDD